MSALLIHKPRERKNLISITALIDIVFILLLFFMLTSTFVKWRTLTLNSSSADGIATQQPEAPTQVILYEDNTVAINQAGRQSGKLSKSGAIAYIQSLQDTDKAKTFVIQSEAHVSTQAIIAMFDVLKTHHITHFTLGDVYTPE